MKFGWLGVIISLQGQTERSLLLAQHREKRLLDGSGLNGMLEIEPSGERNLLLDYE